MLKDWAFKPQSYQGDYSMLKEWAFKFQSYKGEYSMLKEQALKELDEQSKGSFQVIKVSPPCSRSGPFKS